MEIDLSRFRDTFFQEAEEHVVEMESGLLQLEHNSDPELLHAIFRGAHSIKGASGSLGFDEIARFTHAMESLLDRMREGQVAPTRGRVDLLLAALDVLRRLLETARSGAPAPEEDAARTAGLLVVAQRAGDFPSAGTVELRAGDRTAIAWSIRFAPSPDTFRQGMEPVLVLRELARLGEIVAVEPDTSRLPALELLEPDTCYLAWNVGLRSDRSGQEIRDVFAFVEDGAVLEIRPEAARREEPGADPVAPAGQPKAAAARAESGSIRVATAKVDKLIDLVGELVIAQSMASQILATGGSSALHRLQEVFAEVERYTRELQERVMGIRMLPVGSVFSRFPRVVRDLAAATGKEIALEIHGEETELDKGMIERLSDPLMHLVRNAADHGLETPAGRAEAGKPACGRIWLRARHQGGNVVIEVGDDGRGLDPERIYAKALERGLALEHGEATGDQVCALIFEPGFSTAESVSDLSGRGVGLDVVKKSVEALNGTVAIVNQPGRGVTFRIQLPLTLAILDGLLLRVGDERYVLPLTSIMESIAPRHEQVRSVAGKGEVIALRGEPLPLVRLHRLLHRAAANEEGGGLAVIVEHGGKRLALVVDELLGQQQVVIKSLETHFRKVEGVVGATILGDGQPALILDVAALAEMARGAGGDRRPVAA